MNPVMVVQVVRTELEVRGDGDMDPMRRVVQYWTLEGELLASVDPLECEVRARELARGVAAAQSGSDRLLRRVLEDRVKAALRDEIREHLAAIMPEPEWRS